MLSLCIQAAGDNLTTDAMLMKMEWGQSMLKCEYLSSEEKMPNNASIAKLAVIRLSCHGRPFI